MLPSERVVEPMLEFIKTRTQPKKNNEDTPELSFFKSIIPDYLKRYKTIGRHKFIRIQKYIKIAFRRHYKKN